MLAEGAELLAAAGIAEARREARILLAAALGTDHAGLLRRKGGCLSADEAARFTAMLAARAERRPASQIIGEREFWSLPLTVTEATLTPRPDSEAMIEMALDLRPQRSAVRRIADLGTGSGCLLLAALVEYPAAFGLGLDFSEAAARIARANMLRLGFAHRGAIILGDWDAPLAGRFDLILCNPPYIPTADIAGLMPEVRAYEPRLALDGGADGLGPYRRLFPALHGLLTADGLALFEFGIGQAPALTALAAAAGLTVQGVRPDLAGLPRIIAVSLP
ncbi:peptide chain release factor N(5)-glutamine methyltransferase [Acidisoma sp. C75]